MRLLLASFAVLLVSSGLLVKARSDEPAASGSEGGLFDRLTNALWDPRAQLEVLSIHENRTKLGGYGDEVEPDRGYVFQEVHVRVRNVGTTALPVSTWHFSAVREGGSETSAETSMAHHDFDGSALHRDAQRDGLVVFEMPEGTSIRSVVWRGEIAWARADVSGP